MIQGDEPDLIFEPFQAGRWAPLLYLAVVVGCLLGGVLMTGEWFSWPPGSAFHVIAWTAIAMSPLLVFQRGCSYALIGDELAVRRHGKERFRVPLRDYQTTSMRLGWPQLAFRGRSVLAGLWGRRRAPNLSCRATAPCARRRRRAGQARAADRPRKTVRLPVALLRFPAHCVTCAAPAQGTTALTVQRGYDALLYAHFQYVDVQVPVCAVHAGQRGRARWLSWLTTVPLAGVIASAILVLTPGGVWSGALILGAILSLALFRPVQQTFGGQFLDGLLLGVRATDLSPDLTEVTLRCRNRSTFAAVLERASDGGAEPTGSASRAF